MKFSATEIKNVLSSTNPETTEKLARESAALTRQYFGRAIALYAPLYISNYCSSQCVYCGFNRHRDIKRLRLNHGQIEEEAKKISSMRIQDLLLLTGESYEMTPIDYLEKAVGVCKRYFSSLSLEIHPLDENGYRQLFRAGADGVTVYQETYDRQRYNEVHRAGKKQDYDFRYGTPERIALSGIRRISMGILLGLSPLAEDLHALFQHLEWMEKHYPGVEYSVSFPRLRQIKGESPAFSHVDDINFIKAICMTRLAFPRIGINLSTRESRELRDNLLGLGITRISAGSNTSVGGYAIEDPEQQEPQFDVADLRSVQEMIALLKQKNFDPVLTDWRQIANE
ncbi:MAG: 2-iminoacetate synthase ThiH [Candidatus Omnitrophota bacterium]